MRELLQRISVNPNVCFGTGYFVSVKRVEYKGRVRPMMAAYEDIGEAIVAVTIHPLEEKDIQAKIRNGRWKYV